MFDHTQESPEHTIDGINHYEKVAMEAVPQMIDASHHNETRREPMTRTPTGPHSGSAQRTGRWTPDEKILFLYGLKRFGKGRWKKMSVYLPHRSLVQIKSHAQKVLKRLEAGENVFRRLEENCNIVDTLVVQAARQHEALSQTSAHMPKSAAAKRKKQVEAVYMDQMPSQSFDPLYEYDYGSAVGEIPQQSAQVDGDVAALAASALCQLSSVSP